MSIVAMKKLSLFAPKEHSDEILSKLIKLRCVEMHKASVAEEELSPCLLVDKKSEIEVRIGKIETAIDLLSLYEKKKFSFVKRKIDVDFDSFVADGSYERALGVVEQFEDLLEGKKRYQADLNSSNECISELTPWADCDVALNFRGTERTFLIRGSLPKTVSLEQLADSVDGCYAVVEKVSEDLYGIYVTVIGLREYESEISRMLVSYGFNKSADTESDVTAAAVMFEAEKKRDVSRAKLIGIERKMSELASQLDLIKILYDLERTELEKVIKHEMLVSTESVELLCGWVPENKLDALEDVFEKYCCAYEFEDPAEDDDVPVLLKNNKFAENFEWVLSLYSLPKYGSFDPTFIMSICYAILFGIMFADVGYGLIMILAGFLVPKILNPSPWANRFFRSFGWCGVACIFMGILFGGYFGDFPIKIAEMYGVTLGPNFGLALLIDPVKQSMPFMIMGIAVGAVHLIIGMIIKFNIIRKNQSLLDAIFDIGLWWLLFAGIALVFIVPSVGLWVLIAAVVGIFLTGGRHEKKWFMRPLKGLLSFYDIINYASDLLSYSRILALALTSAVIASVVNVLGTMAGPTVPGMIVLVIAFIFGHALNIALNVMGTFVHSARLQYVEFFGKFFEDGGRAFDPLKSNSKYTNNN